MDDVIFCKSILISLAEAGTIDIEYTVGFRKSPLLAGISEAGSRCVPARGRGKMTDSSSYEHFMQEAQLRDEVIREAERLGFRQTIDALHFAERCHTGQLRKGPARLPYIIHPLTMACHALSLRLYEDDLLSVILLHDTCEDCSIQPEELPVNPQVQEAVRILTFSRLPGETRRQAKDRYFSHIPGNRLASITKLLDRCNNLSYMVYGFSRKKLLDYICETHRCVIPILEYAKEHYRDCSSALFLLNYQIFSVMNSIQVLLERKLP